MKTFRFLSITIALLSIMGASFAQEKTSDKKDNTVTFYFARHGKTMLNTLDRVQGWSDTPLTPAGVEVAEYLGLGLKEIEFESAYSSDLGRARQTARIVLNSKGQENLSITEMPAVRETNFGSYEGDLNPKMWGDAALYMHFRGLKEFMDALSTQPTLLQDMLGAVKELDTLGMAENYFDVKARGQKAIREIAEKEAANGGGNILLVSHGMALGIFLSDLDSSGKNPGSSHMGNAAVCKVTYKDGQFTLESFGDMSYVEKGKAMAHKK
ncbi:MAG: histidine phosphatase family protein [Dysgonamonadaceae bacterium]|jgi:probable phosphoglycerate mutase|nr:histidine phosphatase family protein [Dysgonamonadaceae bacterium]